MRNFTYAKWAQVYIMQHRGEIVKKVFFSFVKLFQNIINQISYFKFQSTQASICFTELGRNIISLLLSNKNMVGVEKT